jgi:hypothetical protein
MTDPVDLAIERVTKAGAALRAASDDRVLAWLDQAIGSLADPSSPVGREARTTIASRTGLSTAGAAWALDTTLVELRRPSLENALAAMRAAHERYRATPVRTHALVLAANVFTACLRPMVWSLLARVPLLVKVATHDEGLAELFSVALSAIDPELGEAIAVLWPRGRSEALYARLAARVDLVSAHGGDHAIGEMRAATSATTELVAHGHGLGAVVVLREALSSHLPALAQAIARDVGAYDQRGCLSPHVVLVEKGGELSPRDLAALVAAQGLAPLSRAMPRGALPIEIGAQQVQWRGLASSLHELFEGDGYATSFEGASPVRPTPGYRNVAFHAFDHATDLAARLAIYGTHLKVVAVAGDPTRVVLPSPLAPRVCPPGDMQRPPLLAATDGLPPWHGLLRLG